MNKEQNELVKRYCLFVIDSSFRIYDTFEESKEMIFNELIGESKSRLLERAIRWDELKKNNPFENL
jgi:hypothetical protein